MHFESGNPSVLGIFTVVHRHYIYILLHLPFDGPPFFAKSVCVCVAEKATHHYRAV